MVAVTGAATNDGDFCVELDPSIPAASTVLIPTPDFRADSTDSLHLAWAEMLNDACGTNGIPVQTGYLVIDPVANNDGLGSSPATSNDFKNQGFDFVVP